MKRLFDIIFVVAMLPLLALPMVLIALLVCLTSPGPVIYWSDRVGTHNRIFRMPKFRTMKAGTPAITTHLLPDPDTCVTTFGKFLRVTSLDELPQLWSILRGEMSVVGPRPALFNQDDLIALRSEAGVEKITPGLTGWAQVNGRDALATAEKARLDEAYMRDQSFVFDLKIIFLTFDRVLRCQDISH
ncbi:MAG TPA: sugar transferase [Gammaproteobacteria bacterium]|nr:sugar transferase [Gammaproteobacteria bacterium]